MPSDLYQPPPPPPVPCARPCHHRVLLSPCRVSGFYFPHIPEPAGIWGPFTNPGDLLSHLLCFISLKDHQEMRKQFELPCRPLSDIPETRGVRTLGSNLFPVDKHTPVLLSTGDSPSFLTLPDLGPGSSPLPRVPGFLLDIYSSPNPAAKVCVHLCVSLHVSVYTCVSLCLFFCMSLHQSLSLCIFLCLCVYLYVSVISPCLYVYLCVSVYLWITMCLCIPLCLCVHLYVSVYLCLLLCVCLWCQSVSGLQAVGLPWNRYRWGKEMGYCHHTHSPSHLQHPAQTGAPTV